MKEMSLQQAVGFWAYLRDQFELNKQAVINAPNGSSYKDEKRAEAETYQGLAESFAMSFEPSITSAEDSRVKSIYKDMENPTKDQVGVKV